jgi:threonine dehydrogenase-like Zn-dependent dehydrogenase
MKAIIFNAPGQIALTEIPEPVAGENEVLFKVQYIGLCGSDLNTYRGQMPFVTFPRIPGHEISGIVAGKGSGVPDSISIGDKATVLPYTHCGVCPSCRQGHTNACEFNQTLGVQRDGALTQFITTPYDKVFASNILSLKELALVEPMSVGYHGANRGGVTETDTVLVIGCGTIGIGAISAAARKGATVIGMDIDERKLEHAVAFGATHTINSRMQDALKTIRDLTHNEGVDVVIEAAGSPETFQLALDAVAFAGRVATIGYTRKETSIITQKIVSKELTINGSRNALRVFPSVIQMFERRERPFTSLITRVYPMEQTAEALAFWDQNPGSVSKILIDVNP